MPRLGYSKLVTEKPPLTLSVLIDQWMKNDPIFSRHFRVEQPNKTGSIGIIYHDCRWPKSPYNLGLGEEATAAKIFDNEVWIVFIRHTIYKFKAVHPMFFQKLRGHLYDQHNRHMMACKEHLR